MEFIQDGCRQWDRINMVTNSAKISKSKTRLIEGWPPGLLIGMALDLPSVCRRSALHVEKPGFVFLNPVLHSEGIILQVPGIMLPRAFRHPVDYHFWCGCKYFLLLNFQLFWGAALGILFQIGNLLKKYLLNTDSKSDILLTSFHQKCKSGEFSGGPVVRT